MSKIQAHPLHTVSGEKVQIVTAVIIQKITAIEAQRVGEGRGAGHLEVDPTPSLTPDPEVHPAQDLGQLLDPIQCINSPVTGRAIVGRHLIFL